MMRKERDRLLALVQSFFRDYLRNVRGASDHTIRAYRDALRLFFLFLAGGVTPHDFSPRRQQFFSN